MMFQCFLLQEKIDIVHGRRAPGHELMENLFLFSASEKKKLTFQKVQRLAFKHGLA